jgi:hypothetical protein
VLAGEAAAPEVLAGALEERRGLRGRAEDVGDPVREGRERERVDVPREPEEDLQRRLEPQTVEADVHRLGVVVPDPLAPPVVGRGRVAQEGDEEDLLERREDGGDLHGPDGLVRVDALEDQQHARGLIGPPRALRGHARDVREAGAESSALRLRQSVHFSCSGRLSHPPLA